MSTTGAATASGSAPARTGRGTPSSSIRRRPGCATSAACGGWTPPTPSAASALRPVPDTNAPARSARPGPTRSAGRASTRSPPPRPPGPPPPGARIAELDETIADLDAQITAAREELRGTAAGIEVLPGTVTAPRRGRDTAGSRIAAQEQAIAALRARRRDTINERDQLRLVRPESLDRAPHAHLRHRVVPDETMSTGTLLKFWAGASLSVLLLLLGLAMLLEQGSLLLICVLAVLIVMAVEALLRRRLMVFLLGLAIVAGAGTLIWLFVTHLRVAFGVLALIGAAAIGIANLRTLTRR
ncbi:hypothetical protein F4553_003482 [Allocatelliglobosispora scoriae]|uniref:Uncharacterized protein n=1 Tax=Allocatelliglobosispora scoriae TaxID=643052 RepID=A0A841BT56_9ACTN|nr:hypothetical protein [Allocatelliglobosispora scoriae]MBB5870103.1 hypothetical protein [Allocatelliglobosispora scoriae]